MRNIVNPKQKLLFDPYEQELTETWRKKLINGWQGVFRHVILERLPVQELGSEFSAHKGRPTKELYSVAGLILIKEFKNWSTEQAVDEYCLNTGVQYALNLEPKTHNMDERTLERYMKRFAREGLAKIVMERVTATLIDTLECSIDKQRLDSTHIFSNMANFGRTRLMGVAVKRLLTQLKRHNKEQYNSLDEDFRKRYQPGDNQLFSAWGSDKDSRRLLRQQVAEDMHLLIQSFGDHEQIASRSSYKALERIFYEQCDVEEGRVTVKSKTGGNVMQNPSDPDATYDGHKGQGYQVQLSETCNPENEQQFITSALPQTAVESDSEAFDKVLQDLESNDLLPEEILADTLYCSDENVLLAQEKGVELVGPVPSKSKDDEYEALSIDDFNVDEKTEEVISCPAGHKPKNSKHNSKTGVTKTTMPLSACGRCEYFDQCPMQKNSKGYRLKHTAKDRRMAARRREMQTDVFKERYRARSAIEGTNSGAKRKTGLGKLRVRGIKAVSHQVYMKITGWNILRACCCAKMREIVLEKVKSACLSLILLIFELKKELQTLLNRKMRRLWLKFSDSAYSKEISFKTT